MATTYDFTIVSNQFINGLSLVMPMNEQAYSYIKNELEYTPSRMALLLCSMKSLVTSSVMLKLHTCRVNTYNRLSPPCRVAFSGVFLTSHK